MQGQGQGLQPAWALIRKPEVLLKFALVRYRDCRRRTLASKGIDDVSVHPYFPVLCTCTLTHILCISKAAVLVINGLVENVDGLIT